MLRISKNSKVSVDGAETRYAIFPNDAVVLNNTIDDNVNVWGYGREGKFWFQREHGTDIDEPYLTHDEDGNEVPLKWWYKVAVSNDAKENCKYYTSFYKWYYRCLVECLDVTKRSIWFDGKFFVYDVSLRGPYTSTVGDEFKKFYMPLVQFETNETSAGVMSERCKKTGSDNPLQLSHAHPVSTYAVFSGKTIGLEDEAVFLDVRCVVSNEEKKRRQANIDLCIAEIDALIAKHCKWTDEQGVEHIVTPESIRQITDPDELVLTKVKISKVMYAWICNCTKFGDLPSFESQTLYSAFSRGEMDTVCYGRSHATNVIFERYGITNVTMAGNGHAWTLVNFHTDLYDHSRNDDEWCIHDAQRGGFNKPIDLTVTADQSYVHLLSVRPADENPTNNPCDDHSYLGPSGPYVRDENGNFVEGPFDKSYLYTYDW